MRHPHVTVIVPVKGCRPHSAANWESLLGSDYPTGKKYPHCPPPISHLTNSFETSVLSSEGLGCHWCSNVTLHSIWLPTRTSSNLLDIPHQTGCLEFMFVVESETDPAHERLQVCPPDQPAHERLQVCPPDQPAHERLQVCPHRSTHFNLFEY